MFRSLPISCVAVFYLAWMPMTLLAADESAPESPADSAGPVAGGEQVDELIRQLDADRFSQRQEATQKLTRLGEAAVAALQKAALGESREASVRSIEILKKHLDEGNDTAKAAAKAALEAIAASDNAAAAQRAKNVLQPKPDPVAPQDLPFGAIPLGAAQIQIQVQAFGGQNKKVQTRITNGVKEIEAEDNGRKIKILDDPNNGIKIEVSEKIDGKEQVKKYEAKNAEDLKKNHPEGHKIYQEYSQQQGAIQIRALPLQPGAVPNFQLPLRRIVPPQANRVGQSPRQVAQQLENVARQLEETTQLVKKLIESPGNADEGRKAIEQLEQIHKQLSEAKAKLTP